jgi:hypothetical protein
MKKILVGFFIWSVSSVVLAAAVGPITHGARTSYTRPNFTVSGGSGVTMSALDNGEANTARASATLLASDGTPELKASASAISRDTTAAAQGLQRYRYTGASAITLTVDATFHGVLSNGLGAGGSGFRGSVGLWEAFTTEGILGNPSNAFDDGSVSGFIFEGLPGESFSSTSIFSVIAGGQTLNTSVSLNLDSGAEFFLYGSLSAFGRNGGTANASNTGTFAFDFAGSGISSSDLTVVGNTVSAVPVPAALYLFAPAVIGLLGFKRKTS